jgi:hypothetical protein
VVHARNSERDVLNVTCQLDVQLVFQDIGKWVEIASRVSGEHKLFIRKNYDKMFK